MKKNMLFSILIGASFASIAQQSATSPIYQNNRFAIYSDSIVQDKKFTAKALSTIEIASNYKITFQTFLGLT